VASKRRFLVPATIFLGWYLGFVALAAYAPKLMAESIYEGFTVGYALALTQFVVTWTLGWLYVRKADNEFDPLAERAARRAVEQTDARPSRATDTTDPAGTTTHEEVRR
jgi:uncharacterized membrane protein (DUF485 family)